MIFWLIFGQFFGRFIIQLCFGWFLSKNFKAVLLSEILDWSTFDLVYMVAEMYFNLLLKLGMQEEFQSNWLNQKGEDEVLTNSFVQAKEIKFENLLQLKQDNKKLNFRLCIQVILQGRALCTLKSLIEEHACLDFSNFLSTLLAIFYVINEKFHPARLLIYLVNKQAGWHFFPSLLVYSGLLFY